MGNPPSMCCLHFGQFTGGLEFVQMILLVFVSHIVQCQRKPCPYLWALIAIFVLSALKSGNTPLCSRSLFLLRFRFCWFAIGEDDLSDFARIDDGFGAASEGESD